MWHTGLVAPWHVGSSQTRDGTCVPCIGRRILIHCATREVPVFDLKHALFVDSGYCRLAHSSSIFFQHVFLYSRGWTAKATFPDSLAHRVLHVTDGSLGNLILMGPSTMAEDFGSSSCNESSSVWFCGSQVLSARHRR